MKIGNWNMPFDMPFLIYPPNWKAREELNNTEGSAVCLADLGQLRFLCVVKGSSGRVTCTVGLIVPRKLSQDEIAVICNHNSTQVRCFQRATHQGFKCLPCCCLPAMPFPDVLLLDHVSINVNVLWFVKHVLKG